MSRFERVFANEMAGADHHDLVGWADHLSVQFPQQKAVLDDARKQAPIILEKIVKGRIGEIFRDAEAKKSKPAEPLPDGAPADPMAAAHHDLRLISPKILAAQAAAKGISVEEFQKQLLLRFARGHGLKN